MYDCVCVCVCVVHGQAFDQSTAEALAVPPQGMLLKWTNAFKGWQSRWFCIDQQQGTLQYYIVSGVWV